MRTYKVLYAEDVPHYGFAEIRAADDAAAIETARAHDYTEVATDPEWKNAVCRRIVEIQDQNSKTIAADMALDDCFVRYGGEPDRLRCEAAGEMLAALRDATAALKRIADICEYEDGEPVTALAPHEIAQIHADAAGQLDEFMDSIAKAEGLSAAAPAKPGAAS